MNLNSFRSKKSGFTLIELLVVIAIIAILAAILFPVFAKVREKARQTTCLSNQKQIGLATLEYAQDYEEDYPLAQTTNWGANYDWTLMVSPYIKSGRINGNFSTVNSVFSCPSFPIEPGTGATEQNQYKPLSSVFTDQTQSVNGVGSSPTALNDVDHPADQVMLFESGLAGPYGGDNGDGHTGGTKAAPLAAVADVYQSGAEWIWGSGESTQQGVSSSYTLKGDCDNFTNLTWAGLPWWNGGNCDDWPRYRHNGFCNMLFCDGHAKAIQKGKLDYCKNIYLFRGPIDIPSGNGENGVGTTCY